MDYFKNQNGRTVIVDAKPIRVYVQSPVDPAANVVLVKGWTDHHGTCVDAAAFKKEKPEQKELEP